MWGSRYPTLVAECPPKSKSIFLSTFFATKEKGIERDLGCRPCWASSREAGGLDVVSESGVGTRFDKYLSRIVREIEVPEDENVLLM